jgi:transcriptional regulator with XRE-family HTH domain
MSQTRAHQSLGADLRSLRKARGMTLNALADSLGKSVGWVSQVERDLSRPTSNDLADFSRALQVPPELLTAQNDTVSDETGIIVRHNNRRAVGHRADGLTEELLSPDLTDDFEVVHSTFHPHSRLRKPRSRPTHELGFIITGQLDMEIDGRSYSLQAGDSFRIKGQSYRWANPYGDDCVVVWIISPPIYYNGNLK